MTRKEYEKVSPYTQGYAQWWEGDQPESELRGLTNPYADGTAAHDAWDRGQLAAAEAGDARARRAHVRCVRGRRNR